MLTSLRIQNFRSIRDASVNLGQVNLFTAVTQWVVARTL